ncbi:MAG: VOC family protein [Parashewanella sp.]
MTGYNFGDNNHYLSLSDHGEGNNRNLKGHQIGLAHFAFKVENLDSIVKRLENAGYEIAIQGGADDFQKSVYFLDPDGFEVEFVQYLSDLPHERNRY